MRIGQHLELVKKLAEEQWGEKWIKELVEAYVSIENSENEEQETCGNARRPMIVRAFSNGGCSVDTLGRMYEALGCQIQVRRKNRLIA
jgi:hypothetical protein